MRSGLFYPDKPSQTLNVTPPAGSAAVGRSLPPSITNVKKNARIYDTCKDLLQKCKRSSWDRAVSGPCGVLWGGWHDLCPGGRTLGGPARPGRQARPAHRAVAGKCASCTFCFQREVTEPQKTVLPNRGKFHKTYALGDRTIHLGLWGRTWGEQGGRAVCGLRGPCRASAASLVWVTVKPAHVLCPLSHCTGSAALCFPWLLGNLSRKVQRVL